MGFTQHNTPPAVWAALQAAAAQQPGKTARADDTPAKPALVPALFAPPATWVIGAEVPSLANSREWRARNRVAQAHRKAVSRALGAHLRAVLPAAKHYHAGGNVLVELVRLGGRELDKHDNLPAALKYCLDAVCLMLGADDGDDRIHTRYAQQPGGACGVRISLEVLT